MSQYTDMFDSPITEGSFVTYTTLGGRSAYQNLAVVEDFVELIEKPGNPWYSTGPKSRIPYIRIDQAKLHRATEFYVEKDAHGHPRTDKLCIVRVREVSHLGGGEFQRYSIPPRLGTRRLNEVINITSLVKGLVED